MSKASDAAFEREEDQRALVKVLAVASEAEQQYGGNDPELCAAIERVKRAFLKISPSARPSSAELPGQIAIDGSVAGAPPRDLGAPMAEVFDVPKQCEACGENMLLVWGGSWTPLAHLHPDAPYVLQCGHCAHTIMVSERAYEAVQAERKRTVGASDVKNAVKPGREGMRRTRGAG